MFSLLQYFSFTMFFCFLFFACEIYVAVFVADANLGINRNLCEFRGNKSEPNSCVIYGRILIVCNGG